MLSVGFAGSKNTRLLKHGNEGKLVEYVAASCTAKPWGRSSRSMTLIVPPCFGVCADAAAATMTEQASAKPSIHMTRREHIMDPLSSCAARAAAMRVHRLVVRNASDGPRVGGCAEYTRSDESGQLLRPSVPSQFPARVPARQELLERDPARAATSPQLGLHQDGPAADPIREPGLHRALRVQALQRAAHERPAAVVAEPILVLRHGDAVRTEAWVGQLPERAAADEAEDRVFHDRLSRIGAEGRSAFAEISGRLGAGDGRKRRRAHGRSSASWGARRSPPVRESPPAGTPLIPQPSPVSMSRCVEVMS